MTTRGAGACAVRAQAAGAVPVAHNSAGPRMDIVVGEVRVVWPSQRLPPFAWLYTRARDRPRRSVADSATTFRRQERQRRPGFLAETALEYAEAVLTVLSMPAKVCHPASSSLFRAPPLCV